MTNTSAKSYISIDTGSTYIASKVAADLGAMRAYYGKPSQSQISDFQQELAELLPGGYMARIQYGFERDGAKVVVLEYEARPSGLLQDDNSGRVFSRADISGATWFSFLITSEKWGRLSADEQQQIKDRIPIKRDEGGEPRDGDGYWTADKTYSWEGVETQRRTFRPH